MTADVDTIEPTLAATTAAAEAARTANHAAYHAPRDQPGNIYDRTGAATDLLRNVEQLVRMLAGNANLLGATPGLYTTRDGADPVDVVKAAAATIAGAAARISQAERLVNDAWSDLSTIGVR